MPHNIRDEVVDVQKLILSQQEAKDEVMHVRQKYPACITVPPPEGIEAFQSTVQSFTGRKASEAMLVELQDAIVSFVQLQELAASAYLKHRNAGLTILTIKSCLLLEAMHAACIDLLNLYLDTCCQVFPVESTGQKS